MGCPKYLSYSLLAFNFGSGFENNEMTFSLAYSLSHISFTVNSLLLVFSMYSKIQSDTTDKTS